MCTFYNNTFFFPHLKKFLVINNKRNTIRRIFIFRQNVWYWFFFWKMYKKWVGTSDHIIENCPPRSPVDNNNIYYNNAIIRNSVTVCVSMIRRFSRTFSARWWKLFLRVLRLLEKKRHVYNMVLRGRAPHHYSSGPCSPPRVHKTKSILQSGPTVCRPHYLSHWSARISTP